MRALDWAIPGFFLASPAAAVIGVGETAPDFTLNSLYDGEIRLSDQQGHVAQVWFFGWW